MVEKMGSGDRGLSAISYSATSWVASGLTTPYFVFLTDKMGKIIVPTSLDYYEN